ncbi:quinone oxidoreductase family protein [Actinomadura hibisca]|uniref:quinone oxidoreductase family protein n=1 Tax=Actinomadura hibisca TaxID=68565 RepID=UPI00082FE1B2|nr:zinc-binding dehydrogenase [Actinomadura hibisca]
MTTTEMTALLGGLGPHWQARQVPVPEPGHGQVLVRVHAVALNNADIPMLDGADREYTAGFEFAGQIATVGSGVRGLRAGDRVMGTAPGSFAQYVAADHRHVLPVPDGLADAEAAALPTGLLTEHGALALGGFRPGRTVLITAGASAVGLIGVQIARTLRARRVLATTRTAARRNLLVAAGADRVLVTGGRDLATEVLDATDGCGADVVLDHVGGRTFADCLPATAVGGAVVNIGRLGGAASTIDLDALSYRHLRVRGVSFGFTRPAELGDALATAFTALGPAIADGRVRAVIDHVLPLDEADRAADRLRDHQAHGKVVLTMP